MFLSLTHDGVKGRQCVRRLRHKAFWVRRSTYQRSSADQTAAIADNQVKLPSKTLPGFDHLSLASSLPSRGFRGHRLMRIQAAYWGVQMKGVHPPSPTVPPRYSSSATDEHDLISIFPPLS
ncbi:hypothetical protein DPEC_G00241730 [Dallia pectoralis]|uniref:Uncharacterized protein n=1 Tax=Dallia pectoralis TaxID=75939 RepID=A0ACC2FV96_DALPE|nr:hypothetical protein DPEC_G00241730 [Dallia pectoralis]